MLFLQPVNNSSKENSKRLIMPSGFLPAGLREDWTRLSLSRSRSRSRSVVVGGVYAAGLSLGVKPPIGLVAAEWVCVCAGPSLSFRLSLSMASATTASFTSLSLARLTLSSVVGSLERPPSPPVPPSPLAALSANPPELVLLSGCCQLRSDE
jgi:hypothetical protein